MRPATRAPGVGLLCKAGRPINAAVGGLRALKSHMGNLSSTPPPGPVEEGDQQMCGIWVRATPQEHWLGFFFEGVRLGM